MLWIFTLVSCESTLDTGEEYSDCIQENPRTWENWGEGFFQTWCQSCHSRTTPQRTGAPDGINFDTLDDVLQWEEEIRDSVIKSARMPKGGGIPETVLNDLSEYLDCIR